MENSCSCSCCSNSPLIKNAMELSTGTVVVSGKRPWPNPKDSFLEIMFAYIMVVQDVDWGMDTIIKTFPYFNLFATMV